MKKSKVPRKNERFLVETGFPLKIYIPQGLTKTYPLRSLGEKGFGFYAPARDASLVKCPEIDVRLTFNGRTMNMRGTVQYCTFLPHRGANYFGVQFADIDTRQELLLKTIIQAAVKRGHLTLDIPLAVGE